MSNALPCQKYNQLSIDEKKKMVGKYIQGGGVKGDLKQLLTSTESTSSERNVKSNVTEGYMYLAIIRCIFLLNKTNLIDCYTFSIVIDKNYTKHIAQIFECWYCFSEMAFLRNAMQIFDLHKLSYQNMSDQQRDSLLKDILKECYEREGLEGQTNPPLRRDSAINPLLTTYYYVFRPESIVKEDVDKQKIKLQTDISDISTSRLASLTSGSSAVKVEKWAQAAQALKVVNDGKIRLDKEFHACLSALKDLKAGVMNPSTEMQRIYTEMDKAMGKIEGDIENIRSESAKAKSEIKDGMDEAMAKDWTVKLQKFKEMGMAHLDGLKHLKKRILSLSDEFVKWEIGI